MTTRIPPVVLVEAAKRAIADKRDTKLAHRLSEFGLDPISTTTAIARWRKGTNQPEYPAVMALLEIAGWLDEGAIQRDLTAAAGQAAAEAEELARKVTPRRARQGSPARDRRKRG